MGLIPLDRLYEIESLSSWRAWIEMLQQTAADAAQAGRSPHGERGLKYE